MGIMLKTLRFFPVAAFICASTMLVSEAAFASDDLSRILGNTEEPFALCMQRCDEQTSLGRMSRRGCVPGCEQVRRNFSLRGRSFRTFQRCAEAVERVLLNRTRTMQREQAWCRDNFTHLHHLRGCLDAVDVFYQNVTVANICGRGPVRPAATPAVGLTPVPGATPAQVVGRGAQPVAPPQGAGQVKAPAPARSAQPVAGTAAPVKQDTPKYQTKTGTKKQSKADAPKAVKKAPAKVPAAPKSKVPASGNGTTKKQPAVNATGKGLKALSNNGTQSKEKDAPFMPPAINLEGVVPAPTPSTPVKAPSATVQAPSTPAPEASGAAPALPLQVTTEPAIPVSPSGKGVMSSPGAVPEQPLSQVELPAQQPAMPAQPAVPAQQPTEQIAPVLAAPETVKTPEEGKASDVPAHSASTAEAASAHNATAPVPPAPYVPLPDGTTGKKVLQNDDSLPLLPELSRTEPPTELPSAPARNMDLPSINPLMK